MHIMLKSRSRVSDVLNTQYIFQCIAISTLTFIGRGLNAGLITLPCKNVLLKHQTWLMLMVVKLKKTGMKTRSSLFFLGSLDVRKFNTGIV